MGEWENGEWGNGERREWWGEGGGRKWETGEAGEVSRFYKPQLCSIYF